MDDLFKPKGKVATTKKVESDTKKTQRKYRSLYLSKKTVKVLNTVSLTLKIQQNEYTQDDAILEGLTLLAKKKGIDI